jgi:hypothetical protein
MDAMSPLPRTPRGTWLLAGVLWLAACGVLWLLWTAPAPGAGTAPTPSTVRIWDARTGAEVAAPGGTWAKLRAQAGEFLRRLVQFCETGRWPSPEVRVYYFSPNGQLLVADLRYGVGQPRRPLAWLPAGVALLALPLAGLAWWRVQRMRRAAR